MEWSRGGKEEDGKRRGGEELRGQKRRIRV